MIALGLSALSVLLIWIYKKPIAQHDDANKRMNEAEELRKIYSETIELISEKKYFLNKNVKLTDLASKIGHNDRLVSKAINLHSSGNFNKFINAFRVDHSKELLTGGEFDHYTIEAIAEESGFSNKVSFYNAFKSQVGMSPSEYKRSKQGKS